MRLGWPIKKGERAPKLVATFEYPNFLTAAILLMMGVVTNGGTTRRGWCTLQAVGEECKQFTNH